MRKDLAISLAALLCLSPLLAGEAPSLSGFAGHRSVGIGFGFESGNVNYDMTFWNFFDVVKLSEKSAYFHLVIHDNGASVPDSCLLNGVADWRDNELVYRDGQCVLHITKRDDEIVFVDERGGCRPRFCKGKAAFEKGSFSYADPGRISNLEELLASQEFRAAVKEHQER